MVSSPFCTSMPVKSMESRCTRAGVPVFMRMVLRPRPSMAEVSSLAGCMPSGPEA